MSATGTSAKRVRKPGCTLCRERHIRCDRVRPKCSSCRQAGYPVTCEYQPPALKFRHSALSVVAATESRNHQNELTASTETIVVGSPRREDARRSSDGFTSLTSSTPPASFSRVYFSTQTCSDGGVPLDSFDHIAEASIVEPASVTGISPECSQSPKSGNLSGGLYSLGPRPEHSPGLQYPASPSPEATGSIRNVVSNSTDARVFGFYITHIGYWLDIVSPNRYFGETVPQIALSNRALFYACLTCASRVLTRRGELSEAQGDAYQDAAISTLIPQLSTASTCGDLQRESLIATVVILRMAEQFSEVQEDARCHLVDASSLLISKPVTDENQSLGAAAFWLYMRQTIRAAFLAEEPCKFDMALVANDAGTAPAVDAVWTNRVTTLLARTCSACWNAELDPVLRHGLLVYLGGLLEEWRRSVPETFQPWSEYQADNEPFPTIRYISPWHVVGWQSFYTAKVLIALYKKPGDMNVIEISRYMEAEVLSQCRLLCAITLYCDHIGSSINGTHLVSWCGQFFSRHEEQTRLLRFLQDFMKETAWPNQTCCDRLERIWSGQSHCWVQ